MKPKNLKFAEYQDALTKYKIRSNARILAQAICLYPGCTARELVELAKLPINIVSGRAADLKRLGLVVCHGTKERTKGKKSARLYPAIPTAQAA